MLVVWSERMRGAADVLGYRGRNNTAVWRRGAARAYRVIIIVLGEVPDVPGVQRGFPTTTNNQQTNFRNWSDGAVGRAAHGPSAHVAAPYGDHRDSRGLTAEEARGVTAEGKRR